jgi:T-complex protein 1 subunit zeta
MSSLQMVNAKADQVKKVQALALNINAAKGLQEVLRTNLGPKGTLKMLVGGAGQIKLTKDGAVLLHEMQIQHPTACMIARAATAQDDIVGDGTTSIVLFIGEILKRAEDLLSQGIHPRTLADGIERAKDETVRFLETRIVRKEVNRELLVNMAHNSLLTKLPPALTAQLEQVVVDAVLAIEKKPGEQIDLHMVEIMHMKHKLATDSRLVKGLVLDHGGRHPDMPKKLERCFILTCNVSLEYEKTEVNSGFFWKDAEGREKLIKSERAFTDEKVVKILELKRKVCQATKDAPACNFVVINQKGIDPLSLDMLAKEGIIGLRRAKRRNMERLILACGGNAVNSVDDLTEKDLGYADLVYEEELGDEKYTFVEGVKQLKSCTILIKGPNDHTIAQIKDAIRDGLRTVKNTIDDKGIILGGGAFEVAAHLHLKQFADTVVGKPKLGVQLFSEALLIIPKTLAENSGFDVQESLLKVIDASKKNNKEYGVDVDTGEPLAADVKGVYDNVCVKRNFLSIGPALAQQLLQIDEIIRAGKQMGGDKLQD